MLNGLIFKSVLFVILLVFGICDLEFAMGYGIFLLYFGPKNNLQAQSI
jgi:hypothetical protein